MKRLTIGNVAHVDAGKTTLSESILYTSGSIRKVGRVDNGDAFLDTDERERARGITIFSKEAVFSWKDTEITMLDTPGHVDFSAEMERTLQVLDYAILVISGADGVQGHTKTLWRLLDKYNIPVFLFVNKMDQPGTEKDVILTELKKHLDGGCIDFANIDKDFYEELAMCDEDALESFLEGGQVEHTKIQKLIKERKVFPCYFGSALKIEGVQELLEGIDEYALIPEYQADFGAKVFKIARDEQGNRLTYLKVTGGSLKVKDILGEQEEKVNQIRIYSGSKYEAINEAEAGVVCAVTGLTKTRPGQGFGVESASDMPILEPVLTYRIILPEGVDANAMLPKLRQIEEEEPELHIVWDEELQEIRAEIMGEVQVEILKSLIAERFGIEVEFGTGKIVYKETIASTVEGVGHFEPLRHYAEVHLLLEPGEPGSGMQFATNCSEDILDKNWQRLIMTHLEEREHRGVLTGSVITDMKITIVSGRAHQKHTEGGDFRQATYRAIRQGLMEAESVLLEPYYEFRLEVPDTMLGRAMTDLDKMNGHFEIAQNQDGTSVLTGMAPVVLMQDYQKSVIAYTKGHGKLFCSLWGYAPCHNEAEVVEASGYDPEADLLNPTGSVFCAHGAGFIVPWDEVKDYMHVESTLSDSPNVEQSDYVQKNRKERKHSTVSDWLPTEEIDAILEKTFHANRKDKFVPHKGIARKRVYSSGAGSTSNNGSSGDYMTSGNYNSYKDKSQSVGLQRKNNAEEYLLVDGYNVIFAWDDLKELAAVNMDGARGKLMDILCNYQGIRRCNLIVVFDAYRVQGHPTEMLDYHNIHVVYTKEAETADQFIEKFAHENGRKYKVTVATSDGLEQIIIRGQGCELISSRELQKEIERATHNLRTDYLENKSSGKKYLLDDVSEELGDKLKEIKDKEI